MFQTERKYELIMNKLNSSMNAITYLTTKITTDRQKMINKTLINIQRYTNTDWFSESRKQVEKSRDRRCRYHKVMQMDRYQGLTDRQIFTLNEQEQRETTYWNIISKSTD